MFEKKRKESEDEARYVWSRGLSVVIHIYTFSLICTMSVLVVCHLKFYGQYHLWTLLWRDTTLCVLAELLTICWAICWWGQIQSKLLASKGTLKEVRVGFFFILVATLVFAFLIESAVNYDPRAFVSITLVLICFGGRIVANFYAVWRSYKNSSYYKRVSFIDYCNMPSSEQE